ncbi:hypothetical protein SEA_WHEELBITE_38 [Arthrobacter phage Wheelbite]|uniref:Uncharacterized protein n=1 Tax=Arthrobacter phage Wheelbite TaxID=2015873 RepID=A0A222ZIX7_9CAUD|nr:hypothetical protein KMD23_gp38 [Arthrobacter phage Wheelbite]ASR84131.1 hypothetical protein SEA_WHEELBITE_38 [Arthrobacter phage Wheelbite]
MSPSLAAALFVTAICAAISLLLIVLVTRTVKSRRARRAEAAAAERRAAQRVRDEVNGRYPKPSLVQDRLSALQQAIVNGAAQSMADSKTAMTRTLLEDANAVRQANAPLRRPTPTPAEVRRRAESLSKRTPQRTAYRPSSGHAPHSPSVILTDAPDDTSSRRRDEAVNDAMVSAVVAATAMDAIVSTPSYDPSPSYDSSPSYSSPSYDSGSSSSYDGGGSFGGGDSGSF